MTYNVMAINPGHNGSAALVVDGKLEYYIEEERLSRSKYDGNPYMRMIYILQRYPIDELIRINKVHNSKRQLLSISVCYCSTPCSIWNIIWC